MDGRKVQLPEIKRDNSLPVVMSLEEVRKLISAPKYLKHKLMIATLYGCGLRSYELCALKLCDVDFEKAFFFVFFIYFLVLNTNPPSCPFALRT